MKCSEQHERIARILPEEKRPGAAARNWDAHHKVSVFRLISHEVWEGDSLTQFCVTPAHVRGLVERLEIAKRHHVIDLGCGIGGLSKYLAEVSGCSLTGLDISPVAIDAARRALSDSPAASRCRFIVGDMSDPRLRRGEADAIVVTRILCPQTERDRELMLQRGLFAPHPDWESALERQGFTVQVKDLSEEYGAWLTATMPAFFDTSGSYEPSWARRRRRPTWRRTGGCWSSASLVRPSSADRSSSSTPRTQKPTSPSPSSVDQLPRLSRSVAIPAPLKLC